MSLKQNLLDLLKGENTRIQYNEEHAANKLAMKLSSLIPDSTRPLVVICIGTDRSTGDSLGPIIGSKLITKGMSHFHIYGTLDEPIHAVNLVEKINEIKERHKNPFIVGIDACLGKVKSVGVISLGVGPVKPGAGVNKELIPIGDIHITGVVNVSGFMEFFVLQNTRLSLVMKMADTIVETIALADLLLSRKEEVAKIQISSERINNLN